MAMVNQQVRILNGEDEISDHIYTIVEPEDRKGNFLVQNNHTQKKARVHPTRMLQFNPEGSKVYRHETELRAKCPHCDTGVTVEIGNTSAMCAQHGGFAIDWSQISAGPRPASPEVAKKVPAGKAARKPKTPAERAQKQKAHATDKIDFAALRKAGQLWTRTGVEFDYPGFEVKAHVFIIEDGDDSRKMCFNSYNETWGKKSREEHLKHFIENKLMPGGEKVGYTIKGTIEAEHKKLEKTGYHLEK